MIIRFWGVRGSIPSPSKNTVKIGGNTSCVEVGLDGGETLILDAGSGLRSLGINLVAREKASSTIHLLISHVHWDHIQGIPFFLPAFMRKYTLHFHSSYDLQKLLPQQMRKPFFPVEFDALPCARKFHKIRFGDSFRIGGAVVRTTELPHPQPVCGFRVEEGGKSIVYASDSEPNSEKHIKLITDFARGADVFLHDSQYEPDEYEHALKGRGHTTYRQAIDLAKQAQVKKLVLFHHDPMHSDTRLAEMEKKAKKLLPGTVVAREGLEIKI